MNILFVGFYGEEGRRVVKEACRACSIDEFTLIGGDEVHVEGVRSTFLDKSYFRNARITIADLKGKKAIDSELCERLRHIELEFYHQNERLNRKYEFSSFQARREFYVRSLMYFNDLLERNRFDHIVMSNVPHLGYDTLIYGLAKLKSIPLHFFYRLPIITDKFFYLYAESDWRNHRKAEMTASIQAYHSSSTDEKATVKRQVLPLLGAWSEVVQRREKGRRSVVSSPDQTDSIKNTLMRVALWFASGFRISPGVGRRSADGRLAPERSWLQKTERKVKGQRLVRHYDDISSLPDPSDRYVYFPLHKQPEATTAPLGGDYQDQRLAVRLLSQELPEGWKLYVKEFPHQKESHRSQEFYAELRSLGNVELIKRNVDSLGLVEGAEFTATVTGTATLESFMLGKPAVLFGYSIFTNADGIFDVKTRQDLRVAIDDICGGRTISEEDKVALMYAINRVCLKAYLEPYKPAVRNLDFSVEDNAKTIARAIADLVGEACPTGQVPPHAQPQVGRG